MLLLLCLCFLCMHGVNATVFPLVFCNGLNESQMHLRTLELTEHVFPSALSETPCVRVDACTAQNHRGEAFPRGAWLWRNASALWLDGNDTIVHKTSPSTAYNWHGLEYARVPEGLHVRACEPDFSALRLRHELVCAAGTEVSVDMRAGLRACPSTTPYSLLDCMSTLERRPIFERLPFRAKNTRMAFGSKTWYEACTTANMSGVATELCSLLEHSYELRLPRATTVSRVQMVWYDFSAGFGCFGAADVGVGTRLSRFEHPNRVVQCDEVQHGTLVASADATQCAFECDEGYTQTASACVLGCTVGGAVLTAVACAAGEHSVAQCTGGGVTYYRCVSCEVVPGSSLNAWSAADAGACAYTACEAGSYGNANACAPCPVHHYAPHGSMSACLACDAASTGLYQPVPGQTACTACFAEDPTATCAPGQALVRDYAVIKAYFERTQLHEHENMTAYCEQRRACLPCEPGTFEVGAACESCARGQYQSNFQATACFECAYGQTTNRTGAVDKTECICKTGFE